MAKTLPSIWNGPGGVDRGLFNRRMQELYDVEPKPAEQRTYPLPPILTTDRDRLLPANLESYLADDFAFLAATSDEPKHVAAATVQQHHLNGMAITLAANGGVSSSVIPMIQNLTGMLNQRAIKELSEGSCAKQCVEIIASVHKPRILARLAPRRTMAKGDPSRAATSVRSRLESYATTLRNTKSKKRSFPDDTILHEVKDLVGAISRAEAAPETDTNSVISVIHTAYKITRDGVSLRKRLKECGLAGENLDRREFRQIQAIANYWRICLTLSRAARSHRTAFSKITVHVLQAYPVDYWPSKAHKHHVHAEVQLLVHHETQQGTTLSKPVFIGASKMACFLCDAFIRAYGHYRVSHTHGYLHVRWTVPDRADYSKTMRKRLRATLLKMDADLVAATSAARQRGKRNTPGLQSTIHLQLCPIRQASGSTLLSDPPLQVAQAVQGIDVKAQDCPESKASPVALHPAPSMIQEPARHDSFVHAKTVSGFAQDCRRDSGTIEQDGNPLSSGTSETGFVGPDMPSHFRSAWLDLHVALTLNPGSSKGTHEHGKVHCDLDVELKAPDSTDREGVQFVDVDRLVTGEAVTFTKRDVANSMRLLFTSAEHATGVAAELKWA